MLREGGILTMKIYLERKNGKLHVMQKIKVGSRFAQNPLRTIKIVEDTSQNYADILRWTNAVGHTIEELKERRAGTSIWEISPKGRLHDEN